MALQHSFRRNATYYFRGVVPRRFVPFRQSGFFAAFGASAGNRSESFVEEFVEIGGESEFQAPIAAVAPFVIV